MNRREFGQFMVMVKTVFETKATSKEAMEIWYNTLSDLEYDIATAAVESLARTNSGWIYPAQIRKAYQGIVNPVPSFTEAYQLMTDSVRKFGRYRHQEALDYIQERNSHMHTVVNAIGFQTLCNSGEQFTRGPVERMYKEVVDKGSEALLLGNFNDDIKELRQKALPNFGNE